MKSSSGADIQEFSPTAIIWFHFFCIGQIHDDLLPLGYQIGPQAVLWFFLKELHDHVDLFGIILLRLDILEYLVFLFRIILSLGQAKV